MFSRRALSIVAALCALVAISPIGAQAPRNAPPARRGVDAMATIVAELREEAEAAKKALRLPREEPDYASRTTLDPPREALLRALLRRVHRDPFIDAYIRWQLTSFDPELEPFDHRAFVQLMDNAPPMVENPKADPAAIALLQRADADSPLNPRALERAQEYMLDLDEKERIAKAMNRPALGFREWLAGKLGDEGLRPRQWLIEELAATIRAGWAASDVKARVSRNFSESVGDSTLTPDDRRMAVAQLTQLVGLERKYIHDVTFLASGEIDVEVWTAGVDRADVDNWADRLAGRTP